MTSTGRTAPKSKCRIIEARSRLKCVVSNAFRGHAAVNVIVPATNSDVTAPGLYGGVGGPRFPTHGYKNPYVYQGNLHIQQSWGKSWSTDIGYNTEIGKRLQLGSSYTPNSDQLLPDSLLQSWRENYISRDGTGNTGSDQVPNPFQPTTGPLLGFAGNLGKKTVPYDQTLWAYPYLGGQVIQQNRGFSNYQAVQFSAQKDFPDGLLMGANFTWSKSLGVDGGTSENDFGSEGTGNTLPNPRSIVANKRLSANVWKLSQYIDPVRLRMEFLNPERNAALYRDDPLAPAHYEPSCLFAIVMFSSPLAFLETSGLSPRFVAEVSPLVTRWEQERDAIHRGTILPIGEVPDGVAWTGFVSVSSDRRSGYLLVLRELNSDADWSAPRSLFAPGSYKIETLGGDGSVIESNGDFQVNIAKPLGFVRVKLIRKD